MHLSLYVYFLTIPVYLIFVLVFFSGYLCCSQFLALLQLIYILDMGKSQYEVTLFFCAQWCVWANSNCCMYIYTCQMDIDHWFTVSRMPWNYDPHARGHHPKMYRAGSYVSSWIKTQCILWKSSIMCKVLFGKFSLPFCYIVS